MDALTIEPALIAGHDWCRRASAKPIRQTAPPRWSFDDGRFDRGVAACAQAVIDVDHL